MVEFRKFRATISCMTGTDSIAIPENFHTLIALLVQDRYGNVACVLPYVAQFTKSIK
jgi:hypothetical protein